MNITPEFWDFIEQNVPDYYTREDVLRLANLQVFIDQGDDTYVKGITRKEAILLRDSIVHQLLAEAVSAFSAKMPLAIPGGCSLRDYAETLANIAYESGIRQFRPDHDSRETINSVIVWADEFSRLHKDTDWTQVEYLDTLLAFTEKKLHEAPHLEDSSTQFTIASLDRATIERNGFVATGLSDEDMEELAGLVGDCVCGSQQFDYAIEQACQKMELEPILDCPLCEDSATYDPQTQTYTCNSCGQTWRQEMYVLVDDPSQTDQLSEDLGYPSAEAQNSNACYITEYDYIRLFKQAPDANSYFVAIEWPESQRYMPDENYDGDPAGDSIQDLNELINDEKGLDDFGPSAYWVPLCNLK